MTSDINPAIWSQSVRRFWTICSGDSWTFQLIFPRTKSLSQLTKTEMVGGKGSKFSERYLPPLEYLSSNIAWLGQPWRSLENHSKLSFLWIFWKTHYAGILRRPALLLNVELTLFKVYVALWFFLYTLFFFIRTHL